MLSLKLNCATILICLFELKPLVPIQKKKIQLCESIRSGKTVRQVIVRHIGVANDDHQLEELKKLAATIMKQIEDDRKGPFLFSDLDLSQEKTQEQVKLVETSIEHQLPLEKEPSLPVDLSQLTEESRVVEGFHDTYGTLFQSLGLHAILPKKASQVLKEVVLARIAHPGSKLASRQMLAIDFGIDIPIDRVYRMMDRLHDEREAFQKRIFQATQSLCEPRVNLVLFDVSILYFESTEEDELRKFGYSKDQQFQSTQVVLALATTQEGLPIGYRTFPGNTAEVKTLLIAIEEWRSQFLIGDIRVIGDRAMLSEDNLVALESANIKYVIAAKLKSVPKDIQSKILQKNGEELLIHDELHLKQEYDLPKKRKLIVTYSAKRARKDQKDREKMLDKVKKKVGSGKRVKSLLSNRGYQKYLLVEGESAMVINEEKVIQESLWDGLHGIITNDTEDSAVELLSQYRRLWVIEESFRIQKHNLSMRPIYHFKPERVEAHILLCYLAFALIRYGQQRIKLQDEKLSIEEVRQTLWRAQASLLKDHETEIYYRVPSKKTPKLQKIYQAFGVIRNQKIHQVKDRV